MKTFYEIGFILPDGTIGRGGVKADIRTVGKWIDEYIADGCTEPVFAIPADKYAISLSGQKKLIKMAENSGDSWDPEMYETAIYDILSQENESI